MKSPLIDALRQATEARSLDSSGDALVVDDVQQDALETANEDYPDSETAPEAEQGAERGLEIEPQPDPGTQGEQELKLLEVTGALVVTGAPRTDVDFETEDETMTIAALPDDGHSITQQLYRTTHADERPVQLPGAGHSPSAVTRIGKWSPLLCIVLATAAAGSWWAIQAMGGVYASNSVHSPSDRAFDVGEELADFGLGASPFQLIVSSESPEPRGEVDDQ